MAENFVEDYGWAASQDASSCGYIAPCVLKIAVALKAKRVLDIGSGNGVLCSQISAAGLDVVGVEYDRQGVEIARSMYPTIPFYNFGVQDDSNLLLASEASFDMVVSTEVIEHLFSPHLLPMYAGKVLIDGGYLVVSTPYHGYLKNLALSVFNAWDEHHTPLWHGGHIKFWSKKTLSKLLMENGFEVIGFHGVGRFSYLWKSMILVARKI